MSTAHVQPQSGLQVAREAGDLAAAATEAVLLSGDINRLGPKEKVNYYLRVCDSLGLNPYTQPFEFIILSGKMRFYATKACTEQLRRVNGVSLTILSREVIEGCYVVTARAQDKWGRSDESLGAVPIDGLKGETRSNAMMKAETKAKRRVTLSICGLGLLDESESESIPGAVKVPAAAIAQAAGERSAMPTTAALDAQAAKLRAEMVRDKEGNPIVVGTNPAGALPFAVEQTAPKGEAASASPSAAATAADTAGSPDATATISRSSTAETATGLSADTGEAATDGDVTMLRTQVTKLGWSKPKARSWLNATFGETQTTALTKDQASSALALLLAAQQDDNDGAYGVVYEKLKGQGRVL